ncbi:glycine-rich domain-containing protein 1-like [Quillaja saponaria]|uniref:Glycine-rich domain-containing protein 1-like n=1 Tax=Quillaja saponaria TaxID=32244 RepID=A0AAD7L8A0_QUISA|nr:glycine-rich domain-containing protein 1-like [Quillaja saponaria]
MMALPLKGPSTGTTLVGFHCLPNILSLRFSKGLWLFLLIVNGFGIVTGSIQYSTNLTVRNSMDGPLTTLMLYLLFKALVDDKLKKHGIKCILNEAYNLNLTSASSENISKRISGLANYTKYDLVSAAKRQNPFFYQVSRPHMKNDLFLEGAEARYKGFLYLIKRNKETAIKRFCVPTYDIDLMWHSHQLHPVSYCKDLNEILGKVLEHDDTDSDRAKGKKLDVGFSGTTKQWEQTFGTRYWRAGAMYRGNTPSPVTNQPCSSDVTAKEFIPATQFSKIIQLHDRKVVEVLMEFVSVRNMPEGHKGSLFVLFSKSQPDAIFDAKRKLSISSESGEKQVAPFQCEPTGELFFELMSHPSNLSITRTSKTLGTASLYLQDYLTPVSKLSADKWLELVPKHGTLSSKPIMLRVAVSFSVPNLAPHVLRMIQSRPSSKSTCFFSHSLHKSSCFFTPRAQPAKSWTHVIDETGTEVISLQMRDSENTRDDCIRRKEVIGIMESGEQQILAEIGGDRWSVMGSHWSFHLQKKCGDYGHVFELIGNRMVKFFPGRKLEYEPRYCGKHENEADFLTAVEFSVEDPYGKAVALLDLKSEYFQAKEEWMVLPGIIFAFILSDVLKKEGYDGFTSSKMPAVTEKVDGLHEEGKTSNFTSSIAKGGELNRHVTDGNAVVPERIGLSTGGCDRGCDSGCGNAVKSGGCGGGCGGGCRNIAKSTGCGGCGAGCGNIAKSTGCGGCGAGGCGAGCGNIANSSGCGGCGAGGCGGCGAGCGGGCGNIVQSGGCGGCGAGGCGNKVKSGGCGGCGAGGCGNMANPLHVNE